MQVWHAKYVFKNIEILVHNSGAGAGSENYLECEKQTQQLEEKIRMHETLEERSSILIFSEEMGSGSEQRWTRG